MAEDISDCLQNENSLFDDFRANAVAGENGKVQEHGAIGKFGNWVIENPVILPFERKDCREKSCSTNYSITKFPNYSIFLHPPKIVFLLRLLVVGIRVGQRKSECRRLRLGRKRQDRLRGAV